MAKCKECGTEFNGNFCPNCGTKNDEQTICPKCKCEVEANQKFCQNCGYNISNQEKKNTIKKEKNKKAEKLNSLKLISNLLKFSPVALFGLFSILIWIFLSLPVATILGESAGNVYELLKGNEIVNSIKSFVFVIILSALATAISIVLIYSLFKLDKKYLRIKNIIITLPNLMLYISQIFYILFLIVGIIINVKISNMDLSHGPCSTLLISFSIIFLTLSLGCIIGQILIQKRFNLKDENNVTNNEIKKQLLEPKCIEKVEKPNLTEVKMYRLIKCKNIIQSIIYIYILAWFGLNVFIPLHGFMVDSAKDSAVPSIIGTIFICVLLILLLYLIGSLCAKIFSRIKKFTYKKYKFSSIMLIIMNILFVVAIFFFYSIKSSPLSSYYFKYYNDLNNIRFNSSWPKILTLLFELSYKIFCNLIAYYIIGVALFIPTSICQKKIKNYFWGKKKSSKISFDEFILRRNEAKKKYKLYKKTQAKYNIYLIEKEAYDRQKKANPAKKIITKLKNICLFHTNLLIAFALIIVTCCGIKGIIDYQHNIFRANKLDVFNIGETTKEDVIKSFGKPDKDNSLNYEYFGNEYKKIAEKLDKLQYKIDNSNNLDQLYDLEKEYEKLKNKLMELRFKHISISFNGGTISEIVYDTQYSLAKDSSNKKETSYITVLDTEYSEIEPKIYYKDGSYRSYEITPSKGDVHEDNDRYYIRLYWSDSWGSYSYDAQIE